MQREQVSLSQVVARLVDRFAHEVPDRSIEWRIGELPQVWCDRDLIQQVFANLLDNAVKYTRPRPKAIIEVGTGTADGERYIFVRDNGVGFDMGYARKLFGVFQRLHRQDEFEGTGVGLATVSRIIERHGGRIWAQSAVGKGTEFRFTLAGLGD
jgi:light-regulated signal transduction histidine kinase (bacteriophytochrome)